MKMLYFIIIVTIVAIAIIGLSPARAQLIHENPDKLSYQRPYSTDQRLDNDRERIFLAVESFVQHISTSKFNASRQDIEEFDQYYREYLSLLTVYNDSRPEYSELIPIINEIRATLDYLYNNTQLYALNQSLYNTYGSGSSLLGSNISGAGLRNSSKNTGRTAGESKINVMTIRSLLKNSNIDLLRLENSLGLLESFANGNQELFRQQGWVTGDNYLNLSSSSAVVATGERIDLRLKLTESNVTAAGHLIRFYVGDTEIGNASTGPNGTAVLSYTVDSTDFSDPIRFSAMLVPSADSLSPAVSNVVDVRRRPEMTRLTANMQPQSAVFGDHVRVWGRMTAGEVPVANQIVIIYLGGLLVGNATTLNDGSYSFDMSIDHFMPAGTSNICARYESLPGYALLNGTSPSIALMLGQSPSTITTDLQPLHYRGGDNITVAGSLLTGDTQRPVKGGNVSLCVDSRLIGNTTTDASGSFTMSVQIPYNIAPGTCNVFAAYAPGVGRVLSGSSSEVIPTVFEATAPHMTAVGAGLIAFSGDEMDISGRVVRTDGIPLAGCPVSIQLSGKSLGNATTDASGKYTFTGQVPAWLGPCMLTAKVAGEELIPDTEVSAGSIFIVPVGKTPFMFGAAIAVGIAGVAAAWAVDQRTMRPWRQARRRRAATRAAAPTTGAPLSFTGKFDGLLRQINTDIAAGEDRTGVIANIYIAARLIARSQGIEASDSITPNEFWLRFTEAKPPVTPLLSVIIFSYERAAFGHRPLTEQNLVDACNCLVEIRRMAVGEGH